MKVVATYIERNHRLEMSKQRRKTLEITDPWDVERTVDEIKTAIASYVQKDSYVIVTQYKVGRRTFRL